MVYSTFSEKKFQQHLCHSSVKDNKLMDINLENGGSIVEEGKEQETEEEEKGGEKKEKEDGEEKEKEAEGERKDNKSFTEASGFLNK